MTKSRPYPYMQGADSLVLGRSPDLMRAVALGRIRLEKRQSVHLPMRGSADCARLMFSHGENAGHSPPLLRGPKALVQKRRTDRVASVIPLSLEPVRWGLRFVSFLPVSFPWAICVGSP